MPLSLLDGEVRDWDEVGLELESRLDDHDVDHNDLQFLLVFVRWFRGARERLADIADHQRAGLYYAMFGPAAPGKHLGDAQQDLRWLRENVQHWADWPPGCGQEESLREAQIHTGSEQRNAA